MKQIELKIRTSLIKNVLCAFFINFAVLIVYYKFYNITYETNDEWGFSSFLSGAYGIRSSHLVFSNVFYGGFLELFYSLELGINWFTVFQLLFCFISFFVLSFIALMRTEKYGRTFLRSFCCFSILIIFAFQHYYYLQWTKSAYLIALAGIMLIFYTLHECNGNVLLLIGGGGLVLIGAFLRFDAVYVILAFAFVRCVYDLLIEQKFKFNKAYFKENRRYIATFVIVLTIIFGFELADSLIYKYGSQNEEWKYYKEYNELRSELVDYGIPDYGQHQEYYQGMGLSDIDVAMLANWCFSDEEVFNVESFKKIVALKSKEQIAFDDILSTYNNIVDGAKTNVGIIVVFVGVMFLLKGKQKQGILFALYMLITFILYGYLTYMTRVIFRVEYGIWLCLLMFFIYDYSEKEEKDKARLTCGAWLVMVTLVLSISAHDYKANVGTYTMSLQTYFRDFYEYANAHKENLYMRDVATLSGWTYGFSPLEALPYGYLSNIYLLGGWEVANPITEVQEHYGITNPWRECVDAPNILIVDNFGIDLKVEYIRRHYCPTAQAVLVDNVAGFNVYKIVSD